MKRLIFAAVLFAAAGAAHAIPAADQAHTPIAVTQGKFEEQRARIESEFGKGGAYGEIRPEDRVKVVASLQKIAKSLEGVESVEQLSEEQRVAVFNEQEMVNNILTEAHADSRMVCVREVATGSNRRVTNCATVAERRRRRETAQDMIRDGRGSPLLPPRE